MRRRHLIELHEQPWYPASWRALFQAGLGRSLTLMKAFENFAEPFQEFLDKLRPPAILDMCSGSGEAAISAWTSPALLAGDDRPTVVLSDLFPNVESYAELKTRYPRHIDFIPEPVDVLHPPADAPRVRTMINSFHHFRPEQARSILGDAARNADGIAIYEVTGRTWLNMFQTVFMLPIGAAFLTSFLLRPLRLRNVLLSFLLPVIPLTALFDGVVSNLRTYTPEELLELSRAVDSPGFEWQAGQVAIPKTGLRATYLFGWKAAPDDEGTA